MSDWVGVDIFYYLSGSTIARQGLHPFEFEDIKQDRFAEHKIEYHNKVLTKLFGGNSRYGCYFLAVVIFGIGILRDTL